MNSNRKKTINIFAIGIILLVAVPEVVGHSLFDKPHPENSSVVAAKAFASKLVTSPDASSLCQIQIENDPPGAKIARVAGLYGQYGNFTCKTT
ncbi:MAG: hypothetical protein WBV92_07975 [Nitrosotalea sp.]